MSSTIPQISGGGQATTTFGYDEQGRLTSEADPNGQSLSRTYRADNLVQSQALTAGSSTLASWGYTYVNGDPVNLVDPFGHGPCDWWGIAAVCSAAKAAVSSTEAVGSEAYNDVLKPLVEGADEGFNGLMDTLTSDTSSLVQDLMQVVDLGQTLGTRGPNAAVQEAGRDLLNHKAQQLKPQGPSPERLKSIASTGLRLNPVTGPAMFAADAQQHGLRSAVRGLSRTVGTMAPPVALALVGGVALAPEAGGGVVIDEAAGAEAGAGMVPGAQAPATSVEGTSAATEAAPSLRSLAQQVREAGLHPAAVERRTIAIGANSEGELFAGSSNGFDAGQRAALEDLGITRVPGSPELHAEEELLRGVPGLTRVGTSVRMPCGPLEHDCALQLANAGVQVEP